MPRRELLPEWAQTWPYRWKEQLTTVQLYWRPLPDVIAVRYGAPRGSWELSPILLEWSYNRRRPWTCAQCDGDLTKHRYLGILPGQLSVAWCRECVCAADTAPPSTVTPSPYKEGWPSPSRASLPGYYGIWCGTLEDLKSTGQPFCWRRSL